MAKQYLDCLYSIFIKKTVYTFLLLQKYKFNNQILKGKFNQINAS